MARTRHSNSQIATNYSDELISHSKHRRQRMRRMRTLDVDGTLWRWVYVEPDGTGKHTVIVRGPDGYNRTLTLRVKIVSPKTVCDAIRQF